MIPEGSGQRPGHPPCSIPCEVTWPSRIYVAAGVLPLAYMLAVMRDPAADEKRRDAMAMAAA
jgi:hypothetical protein